MSMDQEQFDALVSRLEELARDRPAAYKQRVRLFALLGYGYIFAIVAVLLGLVVGLAFAVLSGEARLSSPIIKLAAPARADGETE